MTQAESWPSCSLAALSPTLPRKPILKAGVGLGWKIGNMGTGEGGIRHKKASVPTSNPQWSAGAQAAPAHSHSPRERTRLPGNEHGSPSLIPVPTLAPLSHFLALITTITIFTILMDYSCVTVFYSFQSTFSSVVHLILLLVLEWTNSILRSGN